MAKLYFIFFTLCILSCSDDDVSDCRLERLEIIEEYDAYIQAEEGNQHQIELLEQHRDEQLDALDCPLD